MNKQSNPGPFDDEFVPDSGPQQAGSSYLANYLPDKDTTPISLSEISQQMGLSGPRIPAKELIDQTFVILGAKPFASSFSEDNYPYFCVIRLESDNKVYTTVLGGQAVVDILRAIAEADFHHPLRVTLREVQGGRFGHYYVLE